MARPFLTNLCAVDHRILVTGCAGFIGSHTVEALLLAGHSVIGVDNLRTGKRENLASVLAHPQFTWVEADITTPGALTEIAARERPDAIIHLAALVSVAETESKLPLNFRLSILGTQAVIEAAQSAQVPRVVLASSAAVYGEPAHLPLDEDSATRPLGLYGAAKLASEHRLLASAHAAGFTALCLRYFNVFGHRQDPTSPYAGVISLFSAKAKAGLPLTIHGDGKQTRDFLPITEVARANSLAATNPRLCSSVYNVCTGKETSLLELTLRVKESFPSTPPPEFGPRRPADIFRSVGDPALAREGLGFTANDRRTSQLNYLSAPNNE